MIKVDENIWSKVDTDVVKGGVWHDEKGTYLAFSQIEYDAALYRVISDVDAVRKLLCHNFAEYGVGVIECDLCTASGYAGAKYICKQIVQDEPTMYQGSLVIPLPDKSFLFSLNSLETAENGDREAIILDRLLQAGEEFATDPETGKMVGWAQDPYLPEFNVPCLKNRSESREYDRDFPDHPLTKVRTYLDLLPESITLVI